MKLYFIKFSKMKLHFEKEPSRPHLTEPSLSDPKSFRFNLFMRLIEHSVRLDGVETFGMHLFPAKYRSKKFS